MKIRKRPCADCPFLRKDGAIRLGEERIEEIIETDGTFYCHQSVVYEEDDEGFDEGVGTEACAGWLAFCHNSGEGGQMARIILRLGVSEIDLKKIAPEVFDDRDEMLETAI